jgi:hypothetical protein
MSSSVRFEKNLFFKTLQPTTVVNLEALGLAPDFSTFANANMRHFMHSTQGSTYNEHFLNKKGTLTL